MNANEHSAGYKIEKVFVADQEYRIVSTEGFDEIEAVPERVVNFGWDWRPVSSRRFEVVIEVSIDPVRSAPERVSVRVVGLFYAEEGQLSISFPDFVQVNAPAILFPFAREAISSTSGRGPYGAFHLNPLNVRTLMKGFALEKSSGYELMQHNEELARDFGLALTNEPIPE